MSKKFSFTKTLFTLLMTLLLTLTLVACGDNDQDLVDEAVDTVSIVFATGDNANSVTQNLNLPTTLAGDIEIAWTSSNTAVIANNGTVTRGFNDVTVTLTATLTKGDATATKDFTVTVKGHDVDAALAAITITGALTYNATTQIYTVNGNITLPATANGLAVTWESTQPAVISNAGVVTRPAYGQPNANVVLIASINSVEREFTMVVPAITEKPAALILSEARDALLLSGISDGVTGNITLPTVVGTEGVTVTWSSSNTSVVSNLGVVVRGESNITVILTATLSLGAESVTKEFEVVVIAATDYVIVDTIAEAITLSGNTTVEEIYVQINNVTLLGVFPDGATFIDATGVIQVYDTLGKVSQEGNPLVPGQVYNLRGVTSLGFGAYQLSARSGAPVLYFESDGAATTPTPVVVGSVTEMLANHTVPVAGTPLFAQVYRLTAKVRIQGTGNYDTVFVDPTYDGGDIPTAANSAATLDGVVVYYKSNKAAFDNLNGQVVTFDLVLYGYRDDRTVFSTLFYGTVGDIQTSLDDTQTVDFVGASLPTLLPTEFLEAGTINLPSSLQGATITWSSNDEVLINTSTGAVTLPEDGQTEVTLTATVVKGEVSKNFTVKINVGPLEVSTIAEALNRPDGSKVWIEGVVTGFSYSPFFKNADFYVQDETGGVIAYRMAEFVGSFDVKTIKVGDIVKLVGYIGTSSQGYTRVQNFIEGEILSSGNPFVAVEVGTETNVFADFKGQYVYATGTLAAKPVISTSNNDNSVIVNVTTEISFKLYINHPGDMDPAIRQAIIDKLQALEAGDTISAMGPLMWNNGPQIVVYTANDIYVGGYVELNDAEKAQQAAEFLTVPIEVEAATTLNLVTAGAHGSTVVWTSSDDAVINPTTGVVTLPASGNVDITLTATVTVGTEQYVRNIVVTVGEIIRPISEVRTLVNGQIATAQGLVTVSTIGTNVSAFIQDETGGINVFISNATQAQKDAFAVGNIVKLRGTIAFFNNQIQFATPSLVELISTGNAVTPIVVASISEAAQYEGKLVSITAFLKVAGATRASSIVDETGEYEIYFNTSGDETVLTGIAAGTEITIVAPVGRRNDYTRLLVYSQTAVTAGSLGTEAELGAVAGALFVEPADNAEVVADVTLPTSGLFGSVVTWVSDKPAVISNAGVVTRPASDAADEVVTLTYELKIGENLYATGTVVYTVLKEEPTPVGGEQVVYTTGFEVADGFTAATVYNNNAEVLTGPVDFQWATRYGSPSTTSPLIDAMSLQMRWYRAASGSHTTDPIYTYTNFATAYATKVTFFAANATGMNVEVTISVDGGTNWIAPEVFTLTTTSTEYTYLVPEVNQADNVMFKFTIVVPDPMPTADGRLYLDNVNIYADLPVETEVFATGFEVADGFTAATVYNNNAEVLTGPVDFQWATRYGSPSTTSPLIGAMSLQMRWYRAASGSHTTDPIYTYTNFATEAATKITFFAANATGMNVEVTISVDGGTNWIAPEVFTLTTTSTEYTYNVPAEYQAEEVMFKFTIVVPDPMPTSDGRLYLDDVKIFGLR